MTTEQPVPFPAPSANIPAPILAAANALLGDLFSETGPFDFQLRAGRCVVSVRVDPHPPSQDAPFDLP